MAGVQKISTVNPQVISGNRFMSVSVHSPRSVKRLFQKGSDPLHSKGSDFFETTSQPPPSGRHDQPDHYRRADWFAFAAFSFDNESDAFLIRSLALHKDPRCLSS